MSDFGKISRVTQLPRIKKLAIVKSPYDSMSFQAITNLFEVIVVIIHVKVCLI